MLALTAMAQFAVFFSDDAGFGIEMVQAPDATHAEDNARPCSPTGRAWPVSHKSWAFM